jgi:hypothetical protein
MVEKDAQRPAFDIRRTGGDRLREANVSCCFQATHIHDRMPVLLQPMDFVCWLAGSAGTELLKPAPNDYLQVWPVSRRVNSSRALGDNPTLIEQIAAQTLKWVCALNCAVVIIGCL